MVPAVVKGGVFLLLAALLLSGGQAIPFLAAVILHEAGHCLGAGLAGASLRRFGVENAGLHLDFAMENLSYGRECVVLLSGSLFGLLSVWLIPSHTYRTCALGLNLVNLLPIAGLDGGGILHCLLHQVTDGDRADRICRRVSVGAALVFWLAGVWIVLRAEPNLTWLICGMAAVVKSLMNWENGGR